jgi:hypothetical protein
MDTPHVGAPSLWQAARRPVADTGWSQETIAGHGDRPGTSYSVDVDAHARVEPVVVGSGNLGPQPHRSRRRALPLRQLSLNR